MAAGSTMKTAEEHQASQEAFFGAFPDLKPKIDQSFAFGPDWVVASSRGKATHKGDLGDLKATGKKVNLAYAELVRLEEGKIAETWGYWNNLDLLAQLGVFTPPKVTKSSAPYEGPPKVADPDDEKADGEAADKAPPDEAAPAED
jgi:predicted ester cyclase